MKKITIITFFVFLAFQDLQTQGNALIFNVSNSTVSSPHGLIQVVANSAFVNLIPL